MKVVFSLQYNDEWINNLQNEINKNGEKYVKDKYKIDFKIKKTGIKYFEKKYLTKTKHVSYDSNKIHLMILINTSYDSNKYIL